MKEPKYHANLLFAQTPEIALNVLIHESGNAYNFLRNIILKENMNLEERTGNENPFDGLTGTATLMPSFADIDDDKGMDLILGMTRSVALYVASPLSSVHDDDLKNPFSIIPNPNNGNFEIQGSGPFDFNDCHQRGY